MGERRDIGRFSGAELIGQGGFGSVYRASDPEHGRQVAIKVLRGVLGDTERRRFDRERQTMGRLGSHPNIIPVHESGYTEAGEGYLVMELAPGGSLGDRLDAGERMPWDQAAAIGAAIARAAQAAHDQGVLHRDIKPDNILIDAYGNPRLTDFGIASVATNATATTSTTATLAHAAPEVLDGQPPAPAIDIYAIGSMVFTLITGSSPYERDGEGGVTALIGRILTQPVPDLRAWGVPAPVADVVGRALAKQATDRPATAAELSDELTRAVAAAAPVPDGHRTMAAPPPNEGPGAPSGPAPSTAPSPDADPGRTVSMATPPVAIPGQRSGPTAPPVPPIVDGGRSAGRWLLIGAAAVLMVVVGAVAVVALGGDGDDVATGPDGSASVVSDGAGGETTGSAPGASTSEGDGSVTTEAPITTATTIDSSTTATTVAPTSVTTAPPTAPPSCDTTVLAGQTSRFDVEVCAFPDGTVRYQGVNRERDEGIELPACVNELDVIVAQNNGFTYLIDTVSLVVLDPDGVIVVDEAFVGPVATDFSGPVTGCR